MADILSAVRRSRAFQKIEAEVATDALAERKALAKKRDEAKKAADAKTLALASAREKAEARYEACRVAFEKVKEEFNSADASYIGYALVKYCGVGGVDELNHKLRTTCDQRLKDLWMALSNLHQRRVEVQPAQWKEEGLSFLSLRRIFIGQSNCPELATKVAVVTAAMKKVGALMYDYIEDVGAVIQEIIDELESADIDLASFHVELERAGAGN